MYGPKSQGFDENYKKPMKNLFVYDVEIENFEDKDRHINKTWLGHKKTTMFPYVLTSYILGKIQFLLFTQSKKKNLTVSGSDIESADHWFSKSIDDGTRINTAVCILCIVNGHDTFSFAGKFVFVISTVLFEIEIIFIPVKKTKQSKF